MAGNAQIRANTRVSRGILTHLEADKRRLLLDAPHADRERTVRCSIRFSDTVWTMRSTKIPGVWIASGSNSPISTICSTSATHALPQVATMGLKFLAVLRYTRLPDLSALYAFTRDKSARMPR